MCRQFLVICLLLALSEILSGAQASFEQELEKDDRYIEHLRRNTAELSADIAKDVEPPGSASSDDTNTDTKTATQKNDTEKTKTVHGTAQPLAAKDHHQHSKGGLQPLMAGGDLLFVITVAACSVAGLVGIIMAGVCWYKLNRSAKAASDVEYPAYGVTGPNKERIPSPGDRKLAQSAQMYHYQHQKQQMIAMEKANGEMKHDASDEESEEENEEGDYTVYECPGLAPTGEMEVKNPLFSDETPVTPGQEDKKEGGN